MIDKLKAMIRRVRFLMEDRWQEKARSKSLDYELDAIEEKIWEVPDMISSHGDYLQCVDMRYPGPYFLVYVRVCKAKQPYLYYRFSYRLSALIKWRFLLTLRGIRSILDQARPDRPIPYYGCDPRLRQHTPQITENTVL